MPSARIASFLMLPALAGCMAASPEVPMHEAMPSRPATPLPAPGERLERPEGYRLVWHDDFAAGDAPDPSRWRYDTQRNGTGWFNGEQQYYARDRRRNARIEDGRLVIEAHAETLPRDRFADWSGQRFTSARLTTRGQASWHHGYFEVRAKLPCARGAWPAIWLLPEHQDMRWQGGEIDMAEAVGFESDRVHHAVQTAARNFSRGNHLENATALDYCAAFHDYQLLWTADRIVIGIDGRTGFSTDKVDAFDRKMALILNVAVGGDWAGAKGIDDAAFPARLEVESVSVWQRGPSR